MNIDLRGDVEMVICFSVFKSLKTSTNENVDNRTNKGFVTNLIIARRLDLPNRANYSNGVLVVS
jgi:hypothetical protein